MINLILAVIASVLIGTFMRISERHIDEPISMFLANYTVCSILAKLYIGNAGAFLFAEASVFPIILGIICGFSFLGGLLMLNLSIRRNGVVLSTVFQKLGVLVPIVVAMLFYGEMPESVQIVGFLIAIAAIFLIYFEKSDLSGKAASKLSLILLFLINGTSESLLTVYDKSGAPEFKNHFLFFIFFTASVICMVILIVKRKKPSGKELLWGAMIGIPNYYSSRFLLLSLENVPAIVAYPVYNISVILIVCAIGRFAFGEKLNPKKLAGMALIIVSLILLNL